MKSFVRAWRIGRDIADRNMVPRDLAMKVTLDQLPVARSSSTRSDTNVSKATAAPWSRLGGRKSG